MGELLGDLHRAQLSSDHRDAVLQNWTARMERRHNLLGTLRNLFHLDSLDGRVHGERCQPEIARGNRATCAKTVERGAGSIAVKLRLSENEQKVRSDGQ